MPHAPRRSLTVSLTTALLAVPLVITATGAHADTTQTLSACTPTALQTALNAGGTWDVGICAPIPLPQQVNAAPLTVSGTNVTLEYNGSDPADVILNWIGPGIGGNAALFEVTAGSLTLDNLTLEGRTDNVDPTLATRGGALSNTGGTVTLNHDVIKNSSANGAVPANGKDGTAGTPDGTSADDASLVEGGGVWNNGTMTINNTTFTADVAQAANGGAGGAGLAGAPGDPGTAGTGAGTGGTGTKGLDGGSGGAAGNGGQAVGGAIFNGGQLTITGGSITSSDAIGGKGGAGGAAANGGTGGTGGTGGAGGIGSAGNPGVMGGNGGTGGVGGTGGAGGSPGPAGNGGNALGGAIYNQGTAVVNGTQFSSNTASAGNGGAGGAGANPGAGGNGGTGGAGGMGGPDSVVQTSDGGNAGNGGVGGTGGNAGAPGTTGSAGATGGNGGVASGGAIYDSATASIANATFSSDTVDGGVGGAGGAAPIASTGAAAIAGGTGGIGGTGGDATHFNGSVFFIGVAGKGGDGGQGGNGVDGGTAFLAGTGGNGGDANGQSVYGASANTREGCSTVDSDTAGTTAGTEGRGGASGAGQPPSQAGSGGQGGQEGDGQSPIGGLNGPGGNAGGNPQTAPTGSHGNNGVADTSPLKGPISALPCPSALPSSLTLSAFIGSNDPNKIVTVTNAATATIPEQVTGATITNVQPAGEASTLAITTNQCNSEAISNPDSCDIDVTFTPTDTTTVTATLDIADNSVTGHELIPITATGNTPLPVLDPTALTINPSQTITAGNKATLTTTLTDTTTGQPISGAVIGLASKATNAVKLTLTYAGTTNADGQLTVAVAPTVNTAYAWHFAADSTHEQSTSDSVLVSVVPVVAANLAHKTVSHKKKAVVYGALKGGISGEKLTVTFTRSKHKTVVHAKTKQLLLPGHKKKTLGYEVKKKLAKGKYAVVVALPSTVENKAAHSKRVKLRVT